MKQPPEWLVAFLGRLASVSQLLVEGVRAVLVERRVQKPANVLEHDRVGLALPDETHRMREQVAVVYRTELLPRLRERRARNAAREQVNAASPARRVPRRDVLLKRVPVRAVCPEGRARMGVELDHGEVLEASLFESECLPARPSADLDRRQRHRVDSKHGA